MNQPKEYLQHIKQLENIILQASSYQPMYNGRPSCPFCGNYIDDEETHTDNCIVNYIKEGRK